MEQDREKPIPRSLTTLKHLIKIRCAQEARLPREGLRVLAGRPGGPRGDRNLPCGRQPSDRESRAALRTPALDHQTAPPSGHAGAETVRPDALELAGLISSFHGEIRRKTKGWDAWEAGRLRSHPAPVNSGEACG
jgi:hypothetical protein